MCRPVLDEPIRLKYNCTLKNIEGWKKKKTEKWGFKKLYIETKS